LKTNNQSTIRRLGETCSKGKTYPQYALLMAS